MRKEKNEKKKEKRKKRREKKRVGLAKTRRRPIRFRLYLLGFYLFNRVNFKPVIQWLAVGLGSHSDKVSLSPSSLLTHVSDGIQQSSSLRK